MKRGAPGGGTVLSIKGERRGGLPKKKKNKVNGKRIEDGGGGRARWPTGGEKTHVLMSLGNPERGTLSPKVLGGRDSGTGSNKQKTPSFR